MRTEAYFAETDPFTDDSLPEAGFCTLLSVNTQTTPAGNVVVGVAVLGDHKERELLISPSGRIEERQFAVYAFPGFFVIRIYTYPALIDRRFLCSLFFASGEHGQDGEFLHIESPV